MVVSVCGVEYSGINYPILGISILLDLLVFIFRVFFWFWVSVLVMIFLLRKVFCFGSRKRALASP